MSCILQDAGGATEHRFESRVGRATFQVNMRVLASTPKIDPRSGDFPVSAAEAIRIADAYQETYAEKIREHGYGCELEGAALVHAGYQRWYWVVQYRAKFSPRILHEQHPDLGAIVWSLPESFKIKYPVLMNGKLAPKDLSAAELEGKFPPALQRVEDKAVGSEEK